MASTRKYIKTTAAALRAGLPVSYEITVDGKQILTGGYVQEAVKTGLHEITVTVQHKKTGEIHTNVLDSRQTVLINMLVLVNKNQVGTLTLWPTLKDNQNMAHRAAKWAEGFEIAVFNVAL